MKIINRKRLPLVIAVLVLCMIVPVIFSFTSSAEMVDVYTTATPELEWINIYGDLNEFGEAPSDASRMLFQEDGEYRMQTDAYAMWSANDSVSYAYVKSPFNAGNESVMTIKMTVQSWDGTEIGIAVRESLDPGSPAVLFSYRAGAVYGLIRKTQDATYSHNLMNATTPFGEEPMHLKVVVDKNKGRITGYYKINGDISSDEGWTPISTKSAGFVKNCTNLYTGIALSHYPEGELGTAYCNNFSVNLRAPEGYAIEEDGSGGEESPEETPEIELPEDLAAAGDAQLYETFTDGNLLPEESEINLANPLWTVRAGDPVVQVNESETNRYLMVWSTDEPLMMTAGDMEWTDYSVQMDVTFPQDVLISETNQVELLLRHRSAVVGGSADYSVRFINTLDKVTGNCTGQYLQLLYRGCQNSFIPASQTKLAEVCLSTNGMIDLDVAHTIKVDVVDNTFSVYLDDMSTPLMTAVDTNPGGGFKKDPNLTGCIGLVIQNATVQIDNILVRKLNDPMGGDYDNHIMGNYDEPIPDWIAENYGY